MLPEGLATDKPFGTKTYTFIGGLETTGRAKNKARPQAAKMPVWNFCFKLSLTKMCSLDENQVEPWGFKHQADRPQCNSPASAVPHTMPEEVDGISRSWR